MGGAPLDYHDKSTIHVGKYISPMHPLGRNLRSKGAHPPQCHLYLQEIAGLKALLRDHVG